MLTPARSASSTSSPRVRRSKASCTQVRDPPFVNLLPFAEAMTTGRAGAGVTAVGAAARASTLPREATVPARTNSRRVHFMVGGGYHQRL
jgi:hypothetical protein